MSKILIERSIDIEDEVRKALSSHLTVYVKPLPPKYEIPCILIAQVGGSEVYKIDTFSIVLDSRAKHEAQANEYLRNAIGILSKISKNQSTNIRNIKVNSLGGWGRDPVRPELAMYSARIEVTAHMEKTEV